MYLEIFIEKDFDNRQREKFDKIIGNNCENKSKTKKWRLNCY